MAGRAPRRTADGGQALFTGTTRGRTWARDARLALARLQELRAATGRLPAPPRAGSARRATFTGRSPSSAARLVRSRVDNLLAGDRSHRRAGRDRVRRRRPAVRPDVVHPPRRPRHDRQPALEGRAAGRGADLPEGHDHRSRRRAIGTDSFLGEFGMNLSKTARSVAIPSLEIDQPDCRRAMHSSSVGPIDETQLFYLETPRHPARRGAQVHRARLPRAGRRARPAGRGDAIGCASCSRPNGRPAGAARRARRLTATVRLRPR